MSLAKHIQSLITPTIEDLGFDVVRVMVKGNNEPLLQIMAERSDGTGFDVEDCATVSRAISVILDVEDPIENEFTLEVSSPGIDRPLTQLKHYEAWAGFDAKIELNTGLEDGRKRFSGRLLGLGENDTVLIELEDGESYALPFDDVHRAQLLLTDELIAAVTQEPTT
ncbi:MAG: ribosome maturation factor RimP [Rhodospirillaceae bacterium]|nr:MAG: ribosome maturation factor RimP [Rhodospirillaceae bacterium]